MGELRYRIYLSKKGKTPKIKTLPPTGEVLEQHILRTHIQVRYWKMADQQNPPTINIGDYGWLMVDNIPEPVMGISIMAPVDLLKIVACKCSSAKPCGRNNCSCKAAALSCTAFCQCSGQESCQNPHTKCEPEELSDEDDNSEGDD
jgi:hypothetical protein